MDKNANHLARKQRNQCLQIASILLLQIEHSPFFSPISGHYTDCKMPQHFLTIWWVVLYLHLRPRNQKALVIVEQTQVYQLCTAWTSATCTLLCWCFELWRAPCTGVHWESPTGRGTARRVRIAGLLRNKTSGLNIWEYRKKISDLITKMCSKQGCVTQSSKQIIQKNSTWKFMPWYEIVTAVHSLMDHKHLSKTGSQIFMFPKLCPTHHQWHLGRRKPYST